MDNLLNRGLQVGGKLWRKQAFYLAMRDTSRHNSLRCPKIADRAVSGRQSEFHYASRQDAGNEGLITR